MEHTIPGTNISFDREVIPFLHQKYILVFSKDTLLVVSNKLEVVELIVSGNDDDGYVFQSMDEDRFLDSILLVKEAFNKNIHPIELFNLNKG